MRQDSGDAPEITFRKAGARLLELGPELMARLLRTGGAYADIFYEYTVQHHYAWKQTQRRRRPSRSSRREVMEGVGFRTTTWTDTGFSTTRMLGRRALYDAADVAAAILPGGTPPTDTHSTWKDLPEGRLAEPAAESPEVNEILQAAVDAALSLGDGVTEAGAEYYDRTRYRLVLTSEGRTAPDARLLSGLRVTVHYRRDGKDVRAEALRGGAGSVDYLFQELPEQTAKAAVEQAIRLADKRKPAPGTYPVIFEGGWGGVWLHEAAGHLLEADVASTRSGLEPGATVAAEGVTIVDDATLPGGRGSAAFDDEGHPTSRTCLVNNGKVEQHLLDRWHASRMGRTSTGNGRRQDYRFSPLPRMSNLLLLGGQDNPQDLVASVRDGIYVMQVGKGRIHPGHNRLSLEVIEGRRIENGRLTETLGDFWISGLVPDLLRDIRGIGTDFRIDHARGVCEKSGQTVPVSIGAPSVLISSLTVPDSEG